jgi:predicted phage terminase large subunit-like protein
MSLRFIPSALSDNPRGDPHYRSKLEALPRVERERLLGGNWNVRPVAGSYFRRSYFQVLTEIPWTVKRRVRAWDLAATEPSESNKDPDWTVGVRVAELVDGRMVVDHVERVRVTPGQVDETLRRIAAQDGLSTIQAFWQDPAQAGKAQREHIVSLLRGFRVRFVVASEDKETYAGPVSSDAEHGKIMLLQGAWNEPFLRVLEGFPTAKKKDDVDALSRAHIELTKPAQEFKPGHIAGF